MIYERLEQAVEDLDKTVGGLPLPEEAKGVWQDIWYEEAHNSTAMEGNTLGSREVQLLLFEKRAVGGKEMKAYLEVQGYGDAALWVYGEALSGPVTTVETTVTELREIHKRVVEGVWRDFPPEHLDRRDKPGDFRHANLEPLRPGLIPPEWTDVRPLIRDWLGTVNELPANLAVDRPHIIEDFADLHASFERIHPFNDGNGRVGRLVLNLLLVRYGYPPAVINKTERVKYLEALRRADEGDPGPLGEVLARAVKNGIDRFLIPGLAGKHKYVPLSSLSELGLTHNALVLAAQRGRLEATQSNGQWYSSRRCVEDYIRSKYRRGRAA